MEALRWEIPGKTTYPLEQNGLTYQVAFEGNTVQVYEDGQLLIEEDLSEEVLNHHRNPSVPLENQLLSWAQMVLNQFIQPCGQCRQVRLSFPLELTTLAHLAGFYESQGIHSICPSCTIAKERELEEQGKTMKESFLRGELQILGGTEEEIQRILNSAASLSIRHYIQSLGKTWRTGMLKFSDHRFYLVAMKVGEEQLDTFLLLARDSHGKLASLPPETGLPALGFQEGDELELLAFEK
ncbi:hypothetical protein [Ammoniphilus sp. CFH 90114]|uniref:hypothetical protein n=1 Tax=Ammoniphilus sp. CFH 90114 TaxID=2493665 RepID=UPI00100EF64E|nr:hypothetical protein [Ammoniphilus sp. CFH 90114]RXT15257.1 hypothetical protein EIZ39_03330 [Ammoniphilus sp. CFH 90114]